MKCSDIPEQEIIDACIEPEKDLDDIVYEALVSAKKAFNTTIEDYNHDPAFTDIKFTAFILDSTLTTRLRKIEIEGELK